MTQGRSVSGCFLNEALSADADDRSGQEVTLT